MSDVGNNEDNNRELDLRRQENNLKWERDLRRAYYDKQVDIIKEIIDEVISKLNSGDAPQISYPLGFEGVKYISMKIFDNSHYGEKGDSAYLLSNGNIIYYESSYNNNPVFIQPDKLCNLAGTDQIKTGLINLAKDCFRIDAKLHWTNVPPDNPIKKSSFEELFG